MKIAAPSDFRALARRRLPRFLFDYVEGGAGAEQTLTRNVADLAVIPLRQRVLRDVSRIDTSVDLFGEKWALPVALGPIGLAGLYARRGEAQAARAAERAGIPYCLSTVSVCPIREVAEATGKPFWFQLYMIRDRAFMADLLDAAEAAGCTTLVFTVDMPLPGNRYRDIRSGLSGTGGAWRRMLQALGKPGWAWRVGFGGRPHHLGNVAPVLAGRTGLDDFLGWMRENFDRSVTWDDLASVRDRWRGRLIVKGILDAADARTAAELGADGVVVSNHGGRQLDGVPSTARALPAIVDAVGDRVTILVDGGIRSGTDVVRMLGLGARGVLLGRLWIHALAAGGEAGVSQMIRSIDQEIRIALALTGCPHAATVRREIIDGTYAG